MEAVSGRVSGKRKEDVFPWGILPIVDSWEAGRTLPIVEEARER